MSADRTIDVRIAELLGAVWTREPEATADWLSFPQVEPRTKNPIHLRVLAARFDDGRIEAWPALLAYQSDIGSAWLVVEKMRAADWWFCLTQDNTDIWDAKFWQGEPDGWFPRVEAYGHDIAAPVAICHAALKALDAAPSRPPLPTGGEE